MAGKIIKRLYLFAVYIFLYAPLFIVIVLSFNKSEFSTNWTGFTTKWYVKLFNNSTLIDSAINSFIVASSSATLAMIIGTLASVSIFRYRFFGKNFLMTITYILMMSPEIVMGISLLILFKLITMPLGFTTLLIAHTTMSLPFVMIVLFTRLSGFDKSIIEAGKDLGADEWRIFWHIILPSVAPAVVAGWLLSFTISMDDTIVSTFTTGPTFEVLPLKIYSMVRLGIKPEVNALSAIIFLFCIVLVVIAQFLLKERRK